MKQAYSIAATAIAAMFLLGATNNRSDISPSEIAAACDAGSVESCLRLGKKYYDGSGVKRNRSLANKFFSRACDERNASACAMLARSYLNGDGVTKNYKIAFVAADRACQLGDVQKSDALACGVKARVLSEGLGRAPNYEQGFAYINQSCEMGEQSTCLTLAKSLRLGYLTPSNGSFPITKNAVRARELAGTACKEKIPAACYEMAQLPSQDKRDYAYFMARSCDYGMGSSCFQLTKALDSGRARSNPIEGVKSIEYYRNEACRLDERAACRWKSTATLAREERARKAQLARDAEARRTRQAALDRQKANRDREHAAKIARWKRGDCGPSEFYCYLYGERNGIRTGTATASHIKPPGAATSSTYSGSGSAGANSTRRSTPSANQRSSSNKTGGYKITETIRYSQGQKVVARGRCSDGTRFNVEYYPNNGSSSRYYIYSTSGRSIDDVAKKFCRNH